MKVSTGQRRLTNYKCLQQFIDGKTRPDRRSHRNRRIIRL
jgi:hypothetical protein